MEHLKISIIVPIYNTESYLDKCIDSIVNQTYSNLEIILVDDGSPDSCSQICDKWAEKDERIKVIHKSNGGLSDARNTGIDISTGEFIMFVDSDDFIDINIVKNLLLLQYNTDADIVCGGFYCYKEGSIYNVYNEIIKQEMVIFSGIEQLKNMLNQEIDCSACGKLYKRSIINNHRFIKGRYNEDVIFLFTTYANCEKVVYTNKNYYYYRDTDGSITHTFGEKKMHALQNVLEMEELMLEKKIPVLVEMENYKCRICLELGYSIQKNNARFRFPEESHYVKSYIKGHVLYILENSSYNWKDLIHAFIVLIRL